jgi:hypothetical protein
MSTGRFSFNARGGDQRRSNTAAAYNDEGFRGNHFCNPSLVKPVKPPFPSPQSRESVFSATYRILPNFAPNSTTEWDTWRFGPSSTELGNHWVSHMAIRSVGDPPITFILWNAQDESYDRATNPAWLLYNALDKAVRAGQEQPGWGRMLKGASGRGALIPRPNWVFYALAILFERFGKPVVPPDGLLPESLPLLLECSTMLGRSIASAWSQIKPGCDGSDFANDFVHGDPVGIDAGNFLVVYPKERGRPAWIDHRSTNYQGPAVASPTQAAAPSLISAESFRAASAAAAEAANKRSASEERGFDFDFIPTFNGLQASLRPIEADLRRRIRPINDCLIFLSNDDQAELLSKRIKVDGRHRWDALAYAWADFPHWIPSRDSDVYASSVAREQVSLSQPGQDGMYPTAAEMHTPDPSGYALLLGAGAAAPAPAPAPGPASVAVPPPASTYDDQPPDPAFLAAMRAGQSQGVPHTQAASPPPPGERITPDLRERFRPRPPSQGVVDAAAVPPAVAAPPSVLPPFDEVAPATLLGRGGVALPAGAAPPAPVAAPHPAPSAPPPAPVAAPAPAAAPAARAVNPRLALLQQRAAARNQS